VNVVATMEKDKKAQEGAKERGRGAETRTETQAQRKLCRRNKRKSGKVQTDSVSGKLLPLCNT